MKVNFNIFLEIPEFLAKYVLVHSISITETSIYFYFCLYMPDGLIGSSAFITGGKKTTKKPTNKQKNTV